MVNKTQGGQITFPRLMPEAGFLLFFLTSKIDVA